MAIERAEQLFHPDLGSQEGYHGSVWESELCEDKSLIIFFAGRDELFAERGVKFWYPLARISAMWRFTKIIPIH